MAREKEEKQKFRMAREKEKSAMEMEGTKLENFERKETAEINMKEKVVTVRNQEEGVDIINEGDWGACAPCFTWFTSALRTS